MKVYVCCPANLTTGGPEALHQLVDALRLQGCEAYISYHPFSDEHVTPHAYERYSVAARPPVDQPGSVVVVPETMTFLLRQFRRALPVVWWLSVDAYFGWNHKSRLEDWTRYAFQRLARKCYPFGQLHRCRHAVQSEYARVFLKERDLDAVPLSDYLNKELLTPSAAVQRSPQVLYNPRKRMHVTQKLIDACPGVEFKPLIGLSRPELRELLATSMMYIDFGHHPGKDRMPREAAASGCVVVTNRRGSAGYREDVPIPDRYKVDDAALGFVERFRHTVAEIMSDYTSSAAEFQSYVEHIRNQKQVFLDQAAALARSFG